MISALPLNRQQHKDYEWEKTQTPFKSGNANSTRNEKPKTNASVGKPRKMHPSTNIQIQLLIVKRSQIPSPDDNAYDPLGCGR